MLQNIFSHRPPLYDLFDNAELRAVHTPCITSDLMETVYCHETTWPKCIISN